MTTQAHDSLCMKPWLGAPVASTPKLFAQLMAAFNTACELHNADGAYTLLGLSEALLSDPVFPPDDLPVCQWQLVDAHFKLLEVKFQLYTGPDDDCAVVPVRRYPWLSPQSPPPAWTPPRHGMREPDTN